MNWTIKFIGEEQFKTHVAKTIAEYGDNLQPYDIKKFNSNLIDPIKMIFDKNVYNESWSELVKSEIFRQRDKSNNNSIGYFHQRMFQYISGCRVPDNGKEGGWDVIYENEDGIVLPEGDSVHTIYVEMKNKHNTMNSASAGKTYIKMQDQLLKDDDCACYLVEAIAKKSQNIKWETSVNGNKVSHKRIRRVSIDQFYSLVTGEADAFYQICMVLPDVISDVIKDGSSVSVPKDTVLEELSNIAKNMDASSEELSMAMAIYLLGFSSYSGFTKSQDENMINRIYEYAKRINKI